MSDIIPLNELDRCIQAMGRSQAVFPDFCRAVVQGELWFLRPFHVGIEDEPVVVKKGEAFPLALLRDKDGTFSPVFSSEARAEEGMRQGNVPMLTYWVGSMPAKQLLALFGGTSFGMTFNKGCVTGEVAINADLVRDLASGKVFQPTENDPSLKKTGTVAVLDPADYPTEMVQRAFEFMRRHKHFRAAWVLRETATGRPGYVIGVLMEPHDTVLYHDFNLAVHAGHSPDYDTYLLLLDEKSPAGHREMMKQTPPFYTAPDFRPPGA
jgi:SseB protein C-terminal domain